MLLEHVAPEDAKGPVAEAYAVFPPGFPVPAPLQLMSVSPELCRLTSQYIRYYMTHPRLDLGFTASLRYVLANKYDYDFCRNLNGMLLTKAAGLTEAELAALAADPENAPLEDDQKALLRFAVKVVESPKEVSKAEVDALRALGFGDRDIFDAAYHAASFVATSVMWKAFGDR